MLVPDDVFVFEILKRVSVIDLVRIAKASPHLSSVVGEAVRMRVYNVIRGFFSTPGTFLQVLRRCNSIVGGSCALRALSEKEFTPNNIDIYVPSTHTDEMLAYLKDNGYDVTSQAVSEPFGVGYWLKHISSVIYLTRMTASGSTVAHVHQTTSRSAVLPLCTSDLTGIMNFITPRGIVCLYPQLTLRGVVLLHNPWLVTPRCVEQFRSWGFKIRSEPTLEAQYDSLSVRRHLKDKHSLFLPFVAGDKVWYESTRENIEWACPNMRWSADLVQGAWDLGSGEGKATIEFDDAGEIVTDGFE
ncbi:hypothetical protein NP233_g8087 [Leucocoprinus birnbaumii]|uniref:F-box domain-containing protein n=1 Tax=Leucocoprinus birnbaumii TaxID=56174 RepID=A0AAD5VN00_9AGAR|nr:hypothetical protein NP233_g8087 [Leucocoprinus birnbaumii]